MYSGWCLGQTCDFLFILYLSLTFDSANLKSDNNFFLNTHRDLIDINHTSQDDVQYGLNRPRGTWAASQTERALRVVQVFMRQVGGDSMMLDYSNVHMQYLEQQKKEFKVRTSWHMGC